jgi:8-oxo-dGTP pyrophosphatase MutT (NUDIX family)
MKHQYSAGIIVYTKENTTSPCGLRSASNTILYLLLKYGAGHWDFPKGKIEKGETKQEAALRELKEETNLTAQIDGNFEETIEYIFKDYDGKVAKKTVYFFTGYALTTDVKLSHEHTDFTWLPYKDALEQLTYDNAKEILKKANKHTLLTN